MEIASLVVLMVDTEERLASLGNFEKYRLDFIAISHSEIAIDFQDSKLKSFESKSFDCKKRAFTMPPSLYCWNWLTNFEILKNRGKFCQWNRYANFKKKQTPLLVKTLYVDAASWCYWLQIRVLMVPTIMSDKHRGNSATSWIGAKNNIWKRQSNYDFTAWNRCCN